MRAGWKHKLFIKQYYTQDALLFSWNRKSSSIVLHDGNTLHLFICDMHLNRYSRLFYFWMRWSFFVWISIFHSVWHVCVWLVVWPYCVCISLVNSSGVYVSVLCDSVILLLLLPLMMEIQTTNAKWHAWWPHGSNQSLCVYLILFPALSFHILSSHLSTPLGESHNMSRSHFTPKIKRKRKKKKNIQNCILHNDN